MIGHFEFPTAFLKYMDYCQNGKVMKEKNYTHLVTGGDRGGRAFSDGVGVGGYGVRGCVGNSGVPDRDSRDQLSDRSRICNTIHNYSKLFGLFGKKILHACAVLYTNSLLLYLLSQSGTWHKIGYRVLDNTYSYNNAL